MPKIQTISKRGRGILNEDAIILNHTAGLYGVLDGVSSLVPYVNGNNETGGFIAANLVKTYFESLTHSTNLRNHIITVNNLLRDKMMEQNINVEQKEELWGTALAIVRLQDDGVEYIQTGDCMILVVYEDGEVRPLTRTQVSHLEAKALAIWQAGIDNGLKTQSELYETVADTLKRNRYSSNLEGGYGVLNGEENVVRFLEYGKINSTCLTHIIVLSDGLFLPESLAPSQGSYWRYTAEIILEKGIVQYTNDLIALEESDPECIRYARFKKSDDKTALLMSL